MYRIFIFFGGFLRSRGGLIEIAHKCSFGDIVGGIMISLTAAGYRSGYHDLGASGDQPDGAYQPHARQCSLDHILRLSLNFLLCGKTAGANIGLEGEKVNKYVSLMQVRFQDTVARSGFSKAQESDKIPKS